MKTNEKNVARRLTLEEIEALPFASVIWFTSESNSCGVIWNMKFPVTVYVPGAEGRLGGDVFGSGIFERRIDETMWKGSDESYWDKEPDESQLQGISMQEYNEMGDEEAIVRTRLAEAITGRKMNFNRFADSIEMDRKHFWDCLIGKRKFRACEIESIITALNLNADETMEIFFPDNVENTEPATMKLDNDQNLLSIIKHLERIEDGVNALDMLTSGQIKAVGDTVCPEEFNDAFSFIMEKLKDNVTDLRADLTSKYMLMAR